MIICVGYNKNIPPNNDYICRIQPNYPSNQGLYIQNTTVIHTILQIDYTAFFHSKLSEKNQEKKEKKEIYMAKTRKNGENC